MKFFLLALGIGFSQISFSFAQEIEICSFDTNAKAISVNPEGFILIYPNPKGSFVLPTKVKQFVDQVSSDVFKNSLKYSPELIKDGKCNKFLSKGCNFQC